MQKYNQEYKLPTDKEWCAWVSSLGWIQWCDSKHFYKKYYEDSIPIVNTYYSLYKKSKYKKASYQFMTPNRKKINNKIISINSVESFKKRTSLNRKQPFNNIDLKVSIEQ